MIRMMLMLSVLACVSCQLALCGAILRSQICLLHLDDVQRDFMVDRKRTRETGIREMACDLAHVCVACAVELTGAVFPGCIHAWRPGWSLVIPNSLCKCELTHAHAQLLHAVHVRKWWICDSTSAVKVVRVCVCAARQSFVIMNAFYFYITYQLFRDTYKTMQILWTLNTNVYF